MTTIASMAFERARFAQTNRDVQLNQEHDQFVFEQVRACFNLCQIDIEGPFSSLKEALDPTFDVSAHRRRINDLKMRLRRAARYQWRIIQESREWSATFDLALDWTAMRWALMKLDFAGIVRRFHVVGIVDIQGACETLSGLVGEEFKEGMVANGGKTKA